MQGLTQRHGDVHASVGMLTQGGGEAAIKMHVRLSMSHVTHVIAARQKRFRALLEHLLLCPLQGLYKVA